MAKITNTAIVSITGTEDSSANVPINRGVNVATDSSFSDFTTYQTVGGATGLGIFATLYSQIYIRNLDAVNQLTVTVTPRAGAAVLMATLNPGGNDFILLWGASGGAANSGWTAISVAPVAGTCLIEYFLGG